MAESVMTGGGFNNSNANARSAQTESKLGPDPKETEEERQAALAQKDQARYTQYLQQAHEGRNTDLQEGRDRGAQLFGEGKLGRVEAGRAAEIADVIARRKQELGGFTPEEQNAMRSNNMAAVTSANAAASRALKGAQGQAGVRGPVAAAQAARQAQGFAGQTAETERDLFLKNIDARRAAGDAYDKTLTGARAEELGRQTYNIGQGNKELYGQLATEMGYGSLGAGERSSVMQRLLGEQQLRASQEMAAKDQGKK